MADDAVTKHDNLIAANAARRTQEPITMIYWPGATDQPLTA